MSLKLTIFFVVPSLEAQVITIIITFLRTKIKTWLILWI